MTRRTRALRITVSTICLLAAAVALVVAAGVFWPLEPPRAAERFERLLIDDVTVVDLEQGTLRPGQQILVAAGRIQAVGTGIDTEGVHIVDGGGRYALPGLFDMHVHSSKLSPVTDFPLFVAAGVTHVRDMGGCIGIPDPWVACVEDKRAWTAEVNAGRLVGPRFDRITSLAVNGGAEIPTSLDARLGAPDAAGARARVAHDHDRGIDFLKPYSMLPRDGYFALATEARRRGMHLAGHRPLAVSATEAIDAGQRSFEHAFLFLWECFPGADTLRDPATYRAAYDDALRRRMIDEHDSTTCAALHARMAEAGTAFVPTHTTRKLDAFSDDSAYRSDARLTGIPGPLRAFWRGDADAMAARAEDGNESYRAFYRFGLAQTGIAHDAGVIVMAGTDAPDSFVFPGTGLHDELGHLVQAGLTPLEALRAATLVPAEFLGLTGKAGVIAEGARADLVLLDADPLADIEAVRATHGVLLAGAWYDRAALDRMLTGVEETANHWSLWPKFAWGWVSSPIMRRQLAD